MIPNFTKIKTIFSGLLLFFVGFSNGYGQILLEAETLEATAISPYSAQSFESTLCSNGSYSLIQCNAVGDWIEYTVQIHAAGTYKVAAASLKHKNRGACQLFIDDGEAPLGPVIDQYAAEQSVEEIELGNIELTEGSHTFRFVVTGLGGDGAGYYKLAIDYLKLTVIKGLVHWWNFEDGAITKDQQGGEDLVNNGNITVESEGTEPNPPGYGTHGIVLNGVDQYFTIPYKTNAPWQGMEPEGTFVLAFKTPETVPSGATYIFSHYSTANNNRSFAINMQGQSSAHAGRLSLMMGYNGGANFEGHSEIMDALKMDNRYVIFFSFNAANGSFFCRTYDADAMQWHQDITFTYTNAAYLNSTTTWTLGRRSEDDSGYFPGTLYWARVYNMLLPAEEMTKVVATTTTGITMNQVIEDQLCQNYPNPFSETTSIQYTVQNADFFAIDIYNMAGQKIKSLVNQEKDPGTYTIQWNGTDAKGNAVPNGVYFYVLNAKNHVPITRKMILTK